MPRARPLSCHAALALVSSLLAIHCGTEETTDPDGTGGAAPCPAGEVRFEDGVCAPVGVQGCAARFVEEDGTCRPSSAACDDGDPATPKSIPRFGLPGDPGSGCAPVGIADCPARFRDAEGLCRPGMEACAGEPGTIPRFGDPAYEGDGCEPVGIQGCAEVFTAGRADGLCHPSSSACPQGTFAVPSFGCVEIDGPDGCGAGTWGDIDPPGSDPPPTVYVDPGAAPGGDGSKGSPVATIAQAVTKASPGDRIALAAGVYDEPLVVEKPLTVEGRCPSMVRIQGTSAALGSGAIVAVGASGVTLRGFQAGGDGIGILADGAADLVIHRVHVDGARSSGILVRGIASSADISETLVRGTLPEPSTGLGGRGIAIEGGATATIRSSAVVGNRDIGLYTAGSGAMIDVEDVLVEGTIPAPGAQVALGISVELGAQGEVRGSALVENHGIGMLVGEDGEAAARGLLIEGTLPGDTGYSGIGFAAGRGAQATLETSALLGNRSAGVLVGDTGSSLVTRGNLVAGTAPSPAEGNGLGIYAGAGASLSSSHDALVANAQMGLRAAGAQAAVAVTGTLLEAQGGTGLYFDGGAGPIEIVSCAVVASRAYGLFAEGPDTAVTLSRSLIADTAMLSEQKLFHGRGIELDAGVEAHLDGNAIVGHREAGVAMFGKGTSVVLEGNLVARTLGREVDGLYGLGMILGDEAAATLYGGTITESRTAGLVVQNERTQIVARGLLVEATLPQEADGQGGIGVDIADLAAARVEQSAVRDSRVAGVLVGGASTELSNVFVSAVATGSMSFDDGGVVLMDLADGIVTSLGSFLEVSGVQVTGCARAGVLFDDSSGAVSRTVSGGNRWGLVLQGEDRPVYAEGENDLSGNEQGLVSGGDLAVPPAGVDVPE